tara:strand:+ start:633 stop:1433 length:801 start_codon:yes stop_codon:yes gene_type:complete
LPFINTKSIKIYYESAGQGETVLYISGTGGDLRKSPSVFDNDLKNNFHLISYDQRGLGQSEIPVGPYSMKDYAEDAFNFIEKLNLKRVYVIGVSFGGMVAQHLVINHPGIVERLVLMCTSPGGEKYHSFPLHELEEIIDDQEYIRKFISISDLRINADYIKNNSKQYTILTDQIKNYLRSPESKENKGKFLQLGARKDHNVMDLLKNINCPTLIMGGLYDGIAPKDNIDILDKQIPNSVKKFYKGGHGFFLEDHQAWKDVINFLKN